MGLDASIILANQAPRADEIFQNALTLRQLANRTNLDTATTKDTLKAREDALRLRDLVGKNTTLGENGALAVNRQEVINQAFQQSPNLAALAQGNFQQQDSEAEYAQHKQNLDRINHLKSVNDMIGQLAQGANDQESWTRAIQIARENNIPGSDRLPEVYNEGVKTSVLSQALTVHQHLEQQQKAAQMALDSYRISGGFEQQNADRRVEVAKIDSDNANKRADRQQNADQFTISTGLRQQEIENKGGAGAQSTIQKANDAQDVLALLDQAEPILSKSTSSVAGNLIDKGLGAFGFSTDGANAAAQLKAIQGMLVSKMPKMSGPQSDKDVLLYREMAGQIGDPTIPTEQKRAAMQTIREINQRYVNSHGGGNVVSIAEVKQYAQQQGVTYDQALKHITSKGLIVK